MYKDIFVIEGCPLVECVCPVIHMGVSVFKILYSKGIPYISRICLRFD